MGNCGCSKCNRVCSQSVNHHIILQAPACGPAFAPACGPAFAPAFAPSYAPACGAPAYAPCGF